MGTLQIQQVKRRLEDSIVPHLDLSDLSAHGPQQSSAMSLTRALTAFVVHKRSDLSFQDAAASVVDESGDNGIDGLAILPDADRLIVVQSKWSENSRGSAELAEMIKFREGINDLVTMRWDKFGPKVKSRAAELETLLLLNPEVKIEIVFAHMGSGELADVVARTMTDFVADQNDSVGDSFSFSYLDQTLIHQLLIDERQAHDIDLTVTLSDWGSLDGPPKAIYGHTQGSDVAAWLNDNGEQLLAKNVRVFLGDSEVNKGIKETAVKTPDEFWYLNNGITVLCKSFEKHVAGGTDRRVGTFTIKGASVVNGAQTVGALAQLGNTASAQALESVRVTVRFISLDDASDNFGTRVTRATNTQNRIGGRDFVGLDPEQERLRNEFAVERLVYAVRSGESDPNPTDGCTFDEAVVALACSASDVDLATQAKREISRLYADTSKAPYKALFNAETTSTSIWRRVQVLRHVDEYLGSPKRAWTDSRAKGYAIHGNRVIAHLVFSRLERSSLDDSSSTWSPDASTLDALTGACYQAMVEVAEAEYDGYLASLFKNSTKVRRIRSLAMSKLATPKN